MLSSLVERCLYTAEATGPIPVALTNRKEFSLNNKIYEIVLVVNPNYSDQLDQIITSLLSYLEEYEIYILEDWGRRRLAYPIQKLFRAHYLFMIIKCSRNSIKNLQKEIKHQQTIMRYMILNCHNNKVLPTELVDPNTEKLIEKLQLKIIPVEQLHNDTKRQ